MLKGNLLRVILASAKNNQTIANPHIINATSQPTIYNTSVGLVASVIVPLNVPVFGKTSMVTFPSCITANPP